MTPPEGNGSGESPPAADLGTQETQQADLEGGDTPEMTEKLKAQLQVCRTIKPGCTHWNVKANEFPKENSQGGWPCRWRCRGGTPLGSRPIGMWANCARGCETTRANRTRGRRVGMLRPPPYSPAQGQGRAAAGGGTPSSEAEVEAAEGEVDPNKVRRWVQNKQTVRLVHDVPRNP